MSRETAKAALTAVTGISESRAEEALDNMSEAGLSFEEPDPVRSVDWDELALARELLADVDGPQAGRAYEAICDAIGAER